MVTHREFPPPSGLQTSLDRGKPGRGGSVGRLNPLGTFAPHSVDRAFTLVEVLISLVLTGVVLLLVGTAMDVYLKAVDKGRAEVEEAQLARALLHRMADDIRGAVPYEPMDVEAMVPDVPEEIEPPPNAQIGPNLLAADDPDDSDEPAESIVPQTVPGLYGTSDWLQVDTSRLPRLDQYDALLARAKDSPLEDRLSEVKTVAYYVARPGSSGAVSALAGGPQTAGLVRRELDRAVTAYAAQQGILTDLETELEPIAPEVSEIRFRYFDGNEWFDAWDSEELGGLPVAVEITMLLGGEEDAISGDEVLTTTADEEADLRDLLIYRLVVHLPTAEPVEGEEETDLTEEP